MLRSHCPADGRRPVGRADGAPARERPGSAGAAAGAAAPAAAAAAAAAAECADHPASDGSRRTGPADTGESDLPTGWHIVIQLLSCNNFMNYCYCFA